MSLLTSTKYENLLGKVFGKWTILGQDTSVRKYRARYWNALCECGLIKSVIGRDLLNGVSSGCRKCQAKSQRITRIKPLLQNVYDKWTVLRIDENNTRKGTYWICRCECGTVKPVRAKDLRHGISKSCAACGHQRLIKNTDDTIPVWLWNSVIHSAKRRNITLNITKKECFELLNRQRFKCALSGLELYVSKNWSEHKKTKTTASIDRIDSSKDYTLDNIQWVHKHVNNIKQDYNQEYFIMLCTTISNYARTS